MGDRRMVEIKTTNGSLYVYTHSEGYRLHKIVYAAVLRARTRLGDETYWTRIIVDQVTRSGRDSETGFGLSLKPDMEDSYCERPSPTVDVPSITVSALDGSIEVYDKYKKRGYRVEKDCPLPDDDDDADEEG